MIHEMTMNDEIIHEMMMNDERVRGGGRGRERGGGVDLFNACWESQSAPWHGNKV